MKVTLLSKLFNPALNVLPKDSKSLSKSAKLFLYYGLISPSSFGIYTIMPMLQRSLDKLIGLIDREMSVLDAQKLTMPCLGRSAIWKKSDRLELLKNDLYRLTDRDNNEFILQPTHEEEITNILSSYRMIKSSKLPILMYQITTKFRNEMAPNSGLLRSREFLMKDLYSFDKDDQSARDSYERVLHQYNSIFQQLEINFHCVEAHCGGMGGSLSHEFHVASPVGEDIIYQCSSCKKGFNQELHKTNESGSSPSCHDRSCSGTLESFNSIEIGHCFMLGDRYTKPFDVTFTDPNKETKFLSMGCYGIGVTRLLSACVELLSVDDKIRWPKKLVPYRVAVLLQKEGAHDQAPVELKEKIIDNLKNEFQKNNLSPSDIIVDDSNVTIGKKVANSDVVGIPWAIVVKNKEILETVDLYNNKTNHFSIEEAVATVVANNLDRHSNSYESNKISISNTI